jgi:adenylosuccinate synthase
MAISVVIGGQFGSEGKGKVALEIARRDPSVVAAVRIGGTNSGHTAVDRFGLTRVMRQLPAAAIDRNVNVVLPPGTYIDIDIFLREVGELGLGPTSVYVSPQARIITTENREWEAQGDLGSQIGSTQSGTGGSVIARVARRASNFNLASVSAFETPKIAPFLRDTDELLRGYLSAGRRIIIEGTQGFGLSLLHGGFWPNVTSRDTTAAGFLSETGLSPFDVDDITMVLRCHPIRVAGSSGPLAQEINWETVAREAGLPSDYKEYTTVTKKIRRVARFDASIARRAIIANRPSRIVLNHLDYIDPSARDGNLSQKASEFIAEIEEQLEAKVDWVGVGPDKIIDRTTSARREILEEDLRQAWSPGPPN